MQYVRGHLLSSGKAAPQPQGPPTEAGYCMSSEMWVGGPPGHSLPGSGLGLLASVRFGPAVVRPLLPAAQRERGVFRGQVWYRHRSLLALLYVRRETECFDDHSMVPVLPKVLQGPCREN